MATRVLPTKTMTQAVDEALGLIQAERSGRINGLFTRWQGFNRAKFKYCRFRNVTAIAGGSGSGKSAWLNMIEDDFCNPEINPTYLLKYNPKTNNYDWDGRTIREDKIMILAFKYEMDAADEVLRTLSGRVKQSYSYLLSAEVDKTRSNKDETTYNQVTNTEYGSYEQELNKLRDRPIRYVENAGNLEELYATAAAAKEANPEKQLIVTIDHTLLSKKLSEKDDMELIANTAQMAIRLKKVLGAMVIFLCQMNNEIEKPQRRDNPALHFPVKSDVYCASQLYWACDDVVCIHRPELINIDKYGKFNVGGKMISLNTGGLVHGAWIKSRKNKTGNIWFKAQFEQGNLLEINPASMEWKPPLPNLQL